MKKLIAMLLALTVIMSLAACGIKSPAKDTDKTPDTTNNTTEDTTEDTTKDNAGAVVDSDVMSYADYMAAEMDSEVTVNCWVQATQSWWDNKITVYAADKDGAYFLYEMQCAEEDSKKLVPGTQIKVTGTKGEWAGEVEIMDATFEIVESGEVYVTSPVELTDKLGTDELINYQNQLASFTGLTVKEISFKNDGGDDIYVTLTQDDKDYNFCVEVYLTGPETDVYKTASELKAGDIVDVEGFVYWYEGVNPHITAISVQ